MRDSDYYKKYMADPRQSFNDDKLFIIKMIDFQLSDFELLRSFYEEKNVYFAGNYDLVNILLIKFFDTLTKKHNEHSPLPGIYKTESQKINDDKEFLKTLYRKVIVNNEEYDNILKTRTRNWEYDRVPLMDLIILKMAIVELTEMPGIPVKVTMNEYIELAKYFSTPKSKTFVNGVLDRLIKDFKEEGKIKKSGRGLVE
jgi:N utilization substance protein B